MPSSTVENYLKRIYLEQQHAGDGPVPMGRLAAAMQVQPGTVTSMIKVLADSGLVEYEPRSGTRLTQRGQYLAVHVLRRHRLVETFLVDFLNLDWSEVHEEAEELEHAISDKVLERIDQLLGRPCADPHGDPIPNATGLFTEVVQQSLGRCAIGESVRVARVLDQDPEFLQFVERTGLTPGVNLVVRQCDPIADAITVVPDGHQPITIGTAAARKILVEPSTDS